MEVTSGGINDNPWAGVVVPTASNNSPATSRQRQRGATTCTDITLHKLVQAFLVVDVCGCLAGIIYGLVLLLAKEPHDTSVPLWPTVLVWVTAVWLGIRILSVTAALYYSHILELCGLSLAAHLSVVLGLQTLLLSLLSAVYQTRMHHADWWAHHFAHTPVQGSGWLLHTVQPWLWLVLLILALLEVPVRWYLYHAYRYRRLQQEEEDLQQTALISQASTQRRPWWWSRNSGLRAAEVPRTSSFDGEGDLDRDNGDTNDLRRALLEDAEAAADDRVGTNGLPQWARDDRRNRAAAAPPPPSMFSWLFGGKDSDHNPRDDGSVDFASVQEEWASRSEEDPLWWSRDNPQPFVPTSSRATVKATGGTPARVNAFHRTRNNNDNDAANNPQEAQQKIPDFVDTTTSPNSSTHQTTGASVVSEL